MYTCTHKENHFTLATLATSQGNLLLLLCGQLVNKDRHSLVANVSGDLSWRTQSCHMSSVIFCYLILYSDHNFTGLGVVWFSRTHTWPSHKLYASGDSTAHHIRRPLAHIHVWVWQTWHSTNSYGTTYPLSWLARLLCFKTYKRSKTPPAMEEFFAVKYLLTAAMVSTGRPGSLLPWTVLEGGGTGQVGGARICWRCGTFSVIGSLKRQTSVTVLRPID